MRESDRGKGIPGSSRPTSMAEEGVPAVVAMQGGRVRGGAGGKPFTTASKRERGDSHECKRRCRRRNGENGNHRVAEEGWLLRRPRFHTEQRRSYEESISSTSSSGVTTLGPPRSDVHPMRDIKAKEKEFQARESELKRREQAKACKEDEKDAKNWRRNRSY